MYFVDTSKFNHHLEQTLHYEEITFRSISPYANSKLAYCWIRTSYRHAYGPFISKGKMFNHERNFIVPKVVTKKILDGWNDSKRRKSSDMDRQSKGQKECKSVEDYMQNISLMLKYKYDYCFLCTGKIHNVRVFLESSF